MEGRKGIYTFLIFIVSVSFVFGGKPPCIDPISTVDWSFFVDTLQLKGTCSCSTSGKLKVGLHFRVAEPIAFVETPRKAWEFPCFGYEREADKTVRQKDGTNKGDLSKVNVHYIKYPVFGVLNIVFDHICVDKSTEIDFLPSGLSEINPLIWDDELAVLIQPWKLLLATPIAQTTCLADCTASSVSPEVTESLRNSMFWCAGCWGTIFPDTTTTYGIDSVTESALIVTRILDTLHESGQLFLYKETSGLDIIGKFTNAALPSWDVKCSPAYFPVIVKSQYWLNLAYPSPTEAVPIGKFAIPWALKKQIPTEENFVWTVWRIRDCCIGFQYP